MVKANKTIIASTIESLLETFTKDTGLLVESLDTEAHIIQSAGESGPPDVEYSVGIMGRGLARGRYCCMSGCTLDAEFVATWGQLDTDYSEGCATHIFALVDGDADPDKVVITSIEK